MRKKGKGPILFISLLLALLVAGCSTLRMAAYKGDTIKVKELLDQGADVNDNINGETVLAVASIQGHVDTVKLLLDRGASVNKSIGYGLTPLFYAAQRGHTEVAMLLIERGGDLDGAMAKLKSLGDQGSHGLSLLERLATKKPFPERAEPSLLRRSQSPSNAIKSDIDEIPAMRTKPDNNAFAVVIGIENYRSLPKSDYSSKDAALVKSYLKALGFQERNIDFIADEKATKTDLEKSVEAWLPNRVKKDSMVLVYFSGHGAPEPATGDAYIVPYDGDPNYLSVTGYPLKKLYDQLGKLEAREIIVVLDSCFSGAGGRSVLAKGARPLVMMAMAETLPSNMAVLAATESSQISTSSPEKGHGIFTYYFLKAIKEGKTNIAEIHEFIKPLVEDEAKAMNVQQSPSLRPDAEKLRGKFGLRK